MILVRSLESRSAPLSLGNAELTEDQLLDGEFEESESRSILLCSTRPGLHVKRTILNPAT